MEGGAEARLSSAQFGFRSGYGAQDAIFILRRKIEYAWATKNGQSLVLALDWAKAFDSISPDGMLVALRRFGLAEQILDVIKAIYSDRSFIVRYCGHESQKRHQRAGISQGCPLSPSLFVMLMTVVMFDARAKLTLEDDDLIRRGQ